MKIIVSLAVPEVDDEYRKVLMDGLNKECKRLCIDQAQIIDNPPAKAIDINVSRVPSAGVAELIDFTKATLKDMLNLNVKFK